jgi:MoaA/NifB/PqqE/SkfB family radical SAM enzyme
MCVLKSSPIEHGMMPFETIIRMQDTIRKVKRISLSCACEPLLHPELIKIVSFIRRVNKDADIFFITNGTLLNPSIISQLISSGLSSVYISIDGATKETFERIRKGACFETVVDNIREFVKQGRGFPNSFREIGLQAVVSRTNYGELPGILSLAKALSVDSLIVNGLEPYSKEMSQMPLYNIDPDQEVYRLFSRLKGEASEFDIRLKLPELRFKLPTFCNLNRCIVDWKGEVHPCDFLVYERPYYVLGEKKIHPGVSYGNVNNSDLLEIWDSPEYKKLRMNVNRGILPEYCKYCLKEVI